MPSDWYEMLIVLIGRYWLAVWEWFLSHCQPSVAGATLGVAIWTLRVVVRTNRAQNPSLALHFPFKKHNGFLFLKDGKSIAMLIWISIENEGSRQFATRLRQFKANGVKHPETQAIPNHFEGDFLDCFFLEGCRENLLINKDPTLKGTDQVDGWRYFEITPNQAGLDPRRNACYVPLEVQRTKGVVASDEIPVYPAPQLCVSLRHRRDASERFKETLRILRSSRTED